MRPLIFEYVETPEQDADLLEQIEYDQALNLNVVKGTRDPAINEITYNTETFTKAQIDSSESDDDYKFLLTQYLDTKLETRGMVDETESDDDRHRLAVPLAN